MNFKKLFIYLGKKVLLHSLFWIAVLLFYTFFFGLEGTTFRTVFCFSAFLLPVTICTTYTFIYKLIPEYLLMKKYTFFVLYTIYTLIISGFFIILSAFYGLVFLSGMQWKEGLPISKSILFISIAVYLIVILACAYTLLKQNYKTSSKNEELKNAILESQLRLKEQQLQYLKMQIHPHFLFNTLNTLYGFALQQHDKTPDLILKLSNLLDYILYQTQKAQVPLQQEIDHILDYIALEKMRFRNNLDVKIEQHIINPDVQLAPMLLLPFVENSFKHGKLESGKMNIYIKINTSDEFLYFEVLNSKKTNTLKNSGGIDIKNISKRLDMLYDQHYQLQIEDRNAQFEIKLKLNLLKHKPHAV
tara:strand:- start:206 stop:1282 length:1077 start_codon:yes stop_codon:yes gene_type:complete